MAADIFLIFALGAARGWEFPAGGAGVYYFRGLGISAIVAIVGHSDQSAARRISPIWRFT